jgi:molybdenum cofactor biosynthesis enzyme MoaA
MGMHSTLRGSVAPMLGKSDALKRMAIVADRGFESMRHALAIKIPELTPVQPRKLTVAITAQCNLRCKGCKYGRDFMNGSEMSLAMASDLLIDAKASGFEMVRLYGGEPLMHKGLPAIVAQSVSLGLSTYVTTNGILLEKKIDELYEAGLRNLTLGVYGTGEDYDRYVQRPGSYVRLINALRAVRRQYGSKVNLRMNWLLKRPTCSVADFQAAYALAEEFDMPIQMDLVHYSLPYFTEGEDHELQFQPGDRGMINEVVNEMLKLQAQYPRRFEQSAIALRAVPDWLLKGPGMRVPCDAYRMVWVGADGSVQLCYVTFPLGNLNQKRLKDMLFTETHKQAVQDAVALRCPNCHCSYGPRTEKHAASAHAYGAGSMVS